MKSKTPQGAWTKLYEVFSKWTRAEDLTFLTLSQCEQGQKVWLTKCNVCSKYQRSMWILENEIQKYIKTLLRSVQADAEYMWAKGTLETKLIC